MRTRRVRRKRDRVQAAVRAHSAWAIVKETIDEWSDDNASRLAASLAFYTLLSIAPLVVFAVFIAGLAYGDEAARGEIASELVNIVGPEAAEGIQSIVENASAPQAGIIGSALGFIVLVFGASNVFAELRAALNEIWDVANETDESFKEKAKKRLSAFLIVMGVALLLLASTVLSATVSAFGAFSETALPGGEWLWQTANFALSLAVISALFALMFKYLPDAEIAWRDVWVGASVTALLFVIGKSLIGLYLGKSTVSSAYGAAGSVVVLIIWVYYSAQILFFGAELTQVWARHYGKDIKPDQERVSGERAHRTQRTLRRGDMASP